jgi:catechol 2,3-dioxygenase-like lactoylglutathione lyase family enzyme
MSTTDEPARPELFCLEILTSNWERMVAWYRNTLGLRSLIRIDEDRYALLAAGGTRLAILGRPRDNEEAQTRLRLVFELPELPIPPARVHREGFHELHLVDPDGNAVRLIAWPQS